MSSTSTRTTSASFAIAGMSCGHCVASVQEALASVPGIVAAQVSIGAATVTIDGADRERVLGAATAAIEDAGYGVELSAG